MTKNEDILKPFEGIERETLEVENVVEKNKYFTILFFSQLYTQLDTCQKFHPANKWICSYLMNIFQYVTINGTNSEYMNVLCGVPQGSILGPTLFILYINDMCNVSTLLKPILFADDTNLFYSGVTV